MQKVFIFAILFLAAVSSGEEICYGDLGCLDDSLSCHSLRFPPRAPAEINTQFHLYTRLNPDTQDYQLLDRSDAANIKNSLFDHRLPTKFIIHGYTDTIFSDDFQTMKDSLLEKEDMNVVMVDWNDGATAGYNLCRQNIRVVGREVALLARALNIEMGASYGDMHIIGHSLGAHTAGYAGAYQPGFARITGLDPAGPGFRDVDIDCRLDPSDALYVDAIHTDGDSVKGLGIMESVGHADFYPNGGTDMPGCPLSTLSCDHFRAVYYFDESILSTDCSFTSYPCESWTRYRRGLCGSCWAAGCPEMGYNADKSSAQGTFYLTTNGDSPYCEK